MPGTEIAAASWLPGHDYIPREDRQVIRALRRWTGIVDYMDLIVAAESPATMFVTVGPGRAIVDGTVSPIEQGSYIVAPPDSKRLQIAPSDTSFARRDLIVARVYDADFAGGDYAWDREVVTGTPSATPVDPPLPANSIPLAQITVAAGVSTITAAAITDRRNRTDQKPYSCKMHKTNGMTALASTWTKLTGYDVVENDPSGMCDGPNGRITIPVDGKYLVIAHNAQEAFGGGLGNYWVTMGLYLGGATSPWIESSWYHHFAGSWAGQVVDRREFTKGQVIEQWVWSSWQFQAAGVGSPGSRYPYLSVTLDD